MKQEIKVMLSDKQGLTITKDGTDLFKIRIKDDGKDIEFAVDAEVFFNEIKKFCQFDELKHLYK